MLATARVVPFFLAVSATSSSDMKQRTSPPYSASFRLLIPAFPIWVSVTMTAPFRMASSAFSTAPSEKHQVLGIIKICACMDTAFERSVHVPGNQMRISQFFCYDLKTCVFLFLQVLHFPVLSSLGISSFDRHTDPAYYRST